MNYVIPTVTHHGNSMRDYVALAAPNDLMMGLH